MSQGVRHEPVLADLVCKLFKPLKRGTLVDATFGGGGHSLLLRQVMEPEVEIVGIDRDPSVTDRAAKLGFTLLTGDFADLDMLLDEADIRGVSGVLFDFGLSSDQLDDAQRGFSYHRSGPLDMRMDTGAELTAHTVVNTWEEKRLAAAIVEFGEDPSAGRIARAIVANRPIEDTLALAEVIAQATPAALRRKGHPARRTFQALRMVVNRELEAIGAGLQAALRRLNEGGRCVAISYHSLEDRLVKRRFAQGVSACGCPPRMPVCGCGAQAELRTLVRGAARPSPGESQRNRRARSARLRAVEKLAS